jgi:AraC family transcriptional regulator, regulatory protein of adaptative response / methylated-DNA-[protein]-cysteine methyltransferase
MSMPSVENCWQAVSQRNQDYDGQFVVAVKTTGIYCRPSCSSRTPKRENVQFYEEPKEAERMGFRACKRCHPKDSFALDEQAERVQMLCDYIQANLMSEKLSLEDLSHVAHWSPFHLQRTFKEVMGITPRQYAEARRIKCFKEQLKAGLSVTTAAMDAGYSSSSRVYDHAYSRLGMTPSDYQQGGDDITIAYHIAESPLGRLLIGMTERGICAIEMGSNDEELVKKLHKEFPAAYIYPDEEYLHVAMQAVLDYLQGWQPHLDLPLDIRVTAFQQRVLDALLRIPYGETRSYGEIAQMIGQPKAARAVGNACNKNPVPLVIPCHRVVGSDGDLVGYAFGLERKEQLLKLEKEN